MCSHFPAHYRDSLLNEMNTLCNTALHSYHPGPIGLYLPGSFPHCRGGQEHKAGQFTLSRISCHRAGGISCRAQSQGCNSFLLCHSNSNCGKAIFVRTAGIQCFIFQIQVFQTQPLTHLQPSGGEYSPLPAHRPDTGFIGEELLISPYPLLTSCPQQPAEFFFMLLQTVV